MSITTIILMNVGAAVALSAILAAVMLAPSRLRRPLANGHAHRRREAGAVQRQAAARAGRGRPAPWRPAEDS
ncbi:MAG: hypothetical protein ACRDPE_23690 [Solirubrobacterales bacterium]